MAAFVIVHGAFGGGWEWTPVARALRDYGHDVFTPTLTGMGERAHLGQDVAVGLGTHVQDVVAVLEFEDLRDVVLCGASYGGMAATGAADRMTERIALIIYIDGLVPRDGQSAMDLLPEAFADMVQTGLREHGSAWRMPIPPRLLGALYPPGSLGDDQRTHIVDRLADQPVASFTEPLRLTNAVDHLPRAFVRCTASEYADDLGGDPIEPGAARARAEGWPYRELALGHDPHLFDATATAAVLHELAGTVGA